MLILSQNGTTLIDANIVEIQYNDLTDEVEIVAEVDGYFRFIRAFKTEEEAKQFLGYMAIDLGANVRARQEA